MRSNWWTTIDRRRVRRAGLGSPACRTEPFPTQSKEWRRVRAALRRWGARRVVGLDKGAAYAGVLRDLSSDGVWEQFEMMCNELPPLLPVPLSVVFLEEGADDCEACVRRVLTSAMEEAQAEELTRTRAIMKREDTHNRSKEAIKAHYADKRAWARDPSPPVEPTINPSVERFLNRG